MKDINKENLRELVDGSISVVYHKFEFHCKEENRNKLFCFFEGKDAPYYSVRIREYFKDDYLNFSCKNKGNVIKLYSKIKDKGNNYRLGFFIDKDFDSPIANPDIYETPFYSIENFYCTEYCIKNILKNEFYINEEDSNFQPLINLYNEQLSIFSHSILFFNAWYHSLKTKKANESLLSTNVSLDDKLPNNFVNLEIGNITSNYDLDKIKEKYDKAIEVSEEDIQYSLNILKQGVLHYNLRGKYMLQFLIEFCLFLSQDSKTSKIYIKDNINMHTDKNIAISHFSNYALTPDCLNSYLYSLKMKFA